MQELNNTQYFKVEAEKDLDVRDVIAENTTPDERPLLLKELS